MIPFLLLPVYISILSASPPTVVFTAEPKDEIVPWQGQIELRCEVNYSQAVYTWLATRYAPVDLHYSQGFLRPLKTADLLLQKDLEVTDTPWCHPSPNGRLTIKHPGSANKQLEKSSNRYAHAPWLEGAYRCKVTIPGYGSLISRTAQIRLTGNLPLALPYP
ncbi:unnamed protein product [Calicophoron daubneyi]|uniref:Ig-like domain-containing protein n=1 Tax=Calicophoron daubneyi TaxID=300641 RepID=A0AAV2T0Z7_CALDB